jgi:hypothetical protein
VFLSSIKKADYGWAIQQLRGVITANSIKEPVSIVTDRELALIDCIDTQFPKSIHLLCRWHVNINVLGKTKKYFPGPIKDVDGTVRRHPLFQAFLGCWNALLTSTEEQICNDLLQEMRTNFPAESMSYCETTWLL